MTATLTAAATWAPDLDVEVVVRTAIADVYEDTDVSADDRLHVLTLFPCPAKYDTGGVNGMNWWLTQHVDPILQAIADTLRDWWNYHNDVRDHDGRRPSELMARQSYIDACDVARHLIVRGAA